MAKSNQSITFDPLPAKSYGDVDFTVSATASSGLPVSFAATGNCTSTDNTVHLPKGVVGTCYRVTVKTQDGAALVALFKLK